MNFLSLKPAGVSSAQKTSFWWPGGAKRQAEAGGFPIGGRKARSTSKEEPAVQSGRKAAHFATLVERYIRAILNGRSADGGWEVSWQNDIPGFENHVSVFSPAEVFSLAERPDGRDVTRTLWDQESFSLRGYECKFANYMRDETTLARTLRALYRDGLVFINEVPSQEVSVSQIAERIGPLRNTFYGMTWDVKSKPAPTNVAYTAKHLGFHMDLLYMKQPPRLQLLHCLENTCSGGESRFIDALKAVDVLAGTDDDDAIGVLKNTRITYEYKNGGHSYSQTRPVINYHSTPHRRTRTDGAARKDVVERVANVWWSPPFVGRMFSGFKWPDQVQATVLAARKLANTFEQEDLVYTTLLQAGTCVIFDNTRVLHARNAFDPRSGHRWLRGAYLDADVWNSRHETLREQESKSGEHSVEKAEHSGG